MKEQGAPWRRITEHRSVRRVCCSVLVSTAQWLRLRAAGSRRGRLGSNNGLNRNTLAKASNTQVFTWSPRRKHGIGYRQSPYCKPYHTSLESALCPFASC